MGGIMRSLLGVSLLWMYLVACGGGVSVSTSASNVCSEIAEVACHNVYKCCSEGEIERFLGVDEPRTEPQCKEDVRRLCERDIAKLDAAIEEKRVRFDSDLMNNCLEAIVAPSEACATIEEKLPWDEACMNTAWIGLVSDGGKCFNTAECSSKDSFCAANQTCTAKPTTGQACGAPGCATGNFCQAGTCRTQLAAGQPCTLTSQCMPQHFCDTSMLQAVCTAVRNPGEECTSNTSCKSLRCLPGSCSDFPEDECFTDAQCGLGATCDGTPVCSQPQIVVDYCEGTLSVIRSLTN
jgi:hypothetical protein